MKDRSVPPDAAEGLRLGTRGSPLALVQAGLVEARLLALHPDLAGRIRRLVVKTTGDRVQDRTLAAMGGKGLFSKELDEALLGGRIDLAVHSMKDMPTWLSPGLAIACVLPREDPRDALVAGEARSLGELPRGAVLGTASLRRQAQALKLRPDLKVVPLRGNVETRLGKTEAGEVDATLLALAGLRRLGLASRASAVLAPEEMLPAVAQGAIAVVVRADDEGVRARLLSLDHRPSALCVTAERAMLAALDGSCRTPIAGLAEIGADGNMRLRGLVALPDGSAIERAEETGAAEDAALIGASLGERLKARARRYFAKQA